jgi:predicted DNA-binding protein
MASYCPEKFTRVTVDLTHEEYQRLNKMTVELGATKMGFIRRAIEDRMEVIEEQLQEQKPFPPKKR